MRILFALIFLSIGKLNAASCASGTQCFYEFLNNLSDTCGTNDASPAGTLSYSSLVTCTAGTTLLTALGYAVAPSAVRNSMNGSHWTVVGDFDPTDITTGGGGVMWSTNGSGDAQMIGMAMSDGRVRFYWNGSDQYTASGLVSTNTCHNIAWTYDGTNGRVYIDNVVKLTFAGLGAVASNPSDFRIGYYVFNSNPFIGKIQNFRVMNVAATSFPIIDSTATPTFTPGASNTFSPTISPTFTYSPTVSPTPTWSPTKTASPTPTNSTSPTLTRTISPSPTTVWTCSWTVTPTYTITPTVTPIFRGELTPNATPFALWTTCVFKPIATNFSSNIVYVDAYVNTGTGKLMAAIYENSSWGQHLIATSRTYTASYGWNTLSITTQTMAPGNYWLAVEGSNNLKLGSKSPGQDLFLSTQWGYFPSLTSPKSNYIDNSIYARFANY